MIGVPGAGKTLVGLAVAVKQTYQGGDEPIEDEQAVYLSGNGPLAAVLNEALAQDNFKKCRANGENKKITDSRREVSKSILFSLGNTWAFRAEYIVIYYANRALERLKKYCESFPSIDVNTKGIARVLSKGDLLFTSKFRNCMMHYGLEEQGVLTR